MPEGPELFLSSQFVNRLGQTHVFTGKVVKSEVSVKNPDVDWDEKSYKISSTSRGKEVKLVLTALQKENITKKDVKTEIKKEESGKSLCIVFRFGMSGVFRFDSADNMHKHAHLNFFTDSGKVLSFVDVRRFGRWEVGGDWGPERGPCVLQEYQGFRENVMKNLQSAAFNKPICEAMLNQKYFNGVGNYLRAEILYRGGVRPFDKARTVLEKLVETEEVKVKSENADFLQLCHTIPNEVIHLGGKGYDPEASDNDYSEFTAWLQCYYNPKMKNMVDHNGRTIWYHGEAGTMVPKDAKSKGRKVMSPKKKTVTRTKVKQLADHDYKTKKTRKRQTKTAEENDDIKPRKAAKKIKENNDIKPNKTVQKIKESSKVTKRKPEKETENKDIAKINITKVKTEVESGKKVQKLTAKTKVKLSNGTRRSSRLVGKEL